jgi:hypothetical protein
MDGNAVLCCAVQTKVKLIDAHLHSAAASVKNSERKLGCESTYDPAYCIVLLYERGYTCNYGVKGQGE